jgi:AraC family transcriptional regulator
MIPLIKTHPATTLIGKSLVMAFANDQSVALWQGFMPHPHQIPNRLGGELYSAQVYPANFDFDPHTPFTKWATVPVKENTPVPAGLERLIIPEGLYAVFVYKGIPANAQPFFRYIFTQWLPASGYTLDNRPHFEILGSRYKHNDPASEEEVWIPIKK